jgi:hypothetical protein
MREIHDQRGISATGEGELNAGRMQHACGREWSVVRLVIAVRKIQSLLQQDRNLLVRKLLRVTVGVRGATQDDSKLAFLGPLDRILDGREVLTPSR